VAASVFVGRVGWGEVTRAIALEYRLPRALLAFLVGASLSVSGTCFQGLFRNALADPFVVGVSGGASVGAVTAIVLDLPAWTGTAAAFAGGLGAAFVAWPLATVRGRVSVSSLLLAGTAVGSFCGALVSILLLHDARNWSEVMAWLMGSLARQDPWDRVAMVSPCLVVSVALMAVHARELNLLLLGDESAQQLGVEAPRVRKLLLAAGALAASGAVAACGIIGFVGLIVPHVARRFVGPDHRALLPVALLGGGALLTLADLGARAASPQTPLPIGAVTALLGAPFFLYVLRSR
jgi:iron complex transport system permease protein